MSCDTVETSFKWSFAQHGKKSRLAEPEFAIPNRQIESRYISKIFGSLNMKA